MTTLTLKNIPQELYELLRQAAAEGRRSLNSEILFRLETSLGSRRFDTEEFLAKARALRQQGGSTTDEEINRAKATGRP